MVSCGCLVLLTLSDVRVRGGKNARSHGRQVPKTPTPVPAWNSLIFMRPFTCRTRLQSRGNHVLTVAYINRIATAVPANDVHGDFARYARSLLRDSRSERIFDKMLEKSQINHRWSCQTVAADCESSSVNGKVFLRRGRFPPTAERMRVYEAEAFPLAVETLEKLKLGACASDITHIVITSCTGFSAPGLDLQLVQHFGLNPSVERTIVGFMGCYAAINALKLARHIVRSDPKAKVLILCIELCTLHFQETNEIDQILMFLLFADGCGAALVSAEPVGLALDSFYSTVIPGTADLMSWHIRDLGFDMVLSGDVPRSVHRALHAGRKRVLEGSTPDQIGMWAVHPGGRTVLDAVEAAFALSSDALDNSREVLRQFGNMSSATVLFVLKSFLDERRKKERGCALSFGPGLTAETLMFRTAE
jgi:alpha-pyrone synthase